MMSDIEKALKSLAWIKQSTQPIIRKNYGEGLKHINNVNIALKSKDQSEVIRDLAYALNVALGQLTGGMDGYWRDGNTQYLVREALTKHEKAIEEAGE